MRRGPSDRETSVEFCPEQSAGRKAVGLRTRAEGLERKGCMRVRACMRMCIGVGMGMTRPLSLLLPCQLLIRKCTKIAPGPESVVWSLDLGGRNHQFFTSLKHSSSKNLVGSCFSSFSVAIAKYLRLDGSCSIKIILASNLRGW